MARTQIPSFSLPTTAENGLSLLRYNITFYVSVTLILILALLISLQLDTKDHATKPAGNNTALSSFKNKVNLGTEANADTQVETIHQNTINCMQPLGAPGKVADFSTSGLDGSLGIWHVKTLESKLKGLKIA